MFSDFSFCIPNTKTQQHVSLYSFTKTRVMIASGGITLNSINDDYDLIASPSSFVVYVDAEGNILSRPNVNIRLRNFQQNKNVDIAPNGIDCPGFIKVNSPGRTDIFYNSLNVRIEEYNGDLSFNSRQGSINIGVKDRSGRRFSTAISFEVRCETEMLDWIQDWDGSKTKIGDTYVMTPKMFIGGIAPNASAYDEDFVPWNGVYIGPDYESAGVYGYKEGHMIFSLNEHGGTIGGWNIDEHSLYSTSGGLHILASGTIESRDASNQNFVNWRLNEDGSGFLANGCVTWTAQGNTVFAGTVAASSLLYANGAVPNEENQTTALLKSGTIFCPTDSQNWTLVLPEIPDNGFNEVRCIHVCNQQLGDEPTFVFLQTDNSNVYLHRTAQSKLAINHKLALKNGVFVLYGYRVGDTTHWTIDGDTGLIQDNSFENIIAAERFEVADDFILKPRRRNYE